MSRTLLLGRAGSGKTHRVVAAVRALLDEHDAQGRFERFQIVVPTYSQAEHLKRRLLRESDGLVALLDRGIGTFEQLAERETGLRLHALAPAPVRDALLLEALVADDFPDFREVRRFAGFRRAALRFVKEVKASEPEPGAGSVQAAAERLVASSSALAGARGRKLLGLARAMAAYQARIEAAGLLDHEDLLARLLIRLRERPPEALRLFALDGFTDLTQVQERIVQILSENAERSLVTLLGDPGGRRDGPFASSAALLGRLTSASGFRAEMLADTPRFRHPDLLRVAARAAGDDVPVAAFTGGVRVLAGADPADEADRVARTCRRFVAEGVARGAVLIVVRRLDSDTGRRVLDALRRHGIPFRRSGGTPLPEIPAARSALRALRLLAGADASGDVLAALTSGDARDVADASADALRAAAAPRGARSVAGLGELARTLGLADVSRWLARLASRRLAPEPAPPTDVARALLGALPELAAWTYEGAVPAEAAARAAMDAAALRRVRDVVAEVVRAAVAAGRAEVTPGDLVADVVAAASDARVAVRDRRVDVVNVVDAEEARQWEAEAVIVAGLRMGEFPAGAREDLFVSDHDRADVARGAGLRLPARMDDALHRERLLFYGAVTRARSRLVLTTPVADAKGDPVLPSPFLESLRDALPRDAREPQGASRTPGDQRSEPGETFDDGDVRRTALAAMGERHVPGGEAEVRARTGIALANRVLAVGGAAASRLMLAARGRERAPERLVTGGPAARAMARRRPRSASSLASFAQCPYQHFAAKGLGLDEPERTPEDGLDALLAGTIAHRALELALRARLEGAELSAASAHAAFEAAWAEHAAEVAPGIGVVRDRAALRRAVLREVLREAAGPLVPGFVPQRLEWAFGMGGEPPLVIDGEDGPVQVRGQVDRLDVDAAGRALVVDYKWSTYGGYASLESKIDDGRDIQLPLYALAATELAGTPVLAAGYLTLRDGRTRWLRFGPDAPGTRWDVDWSETGAADERLRDIAQLVTWRDADIRSGRIDVDPADEARCSWCAFADLCRRHEHRSARPAPDARTP